jgi:superfamily II DNA/RNA helicase
VRLSSDFCNSVDGLLWTPQSRFLVLNQCNYIVLDEADRMLEMGFEVQMNSILDAMPSSNLRPMDMEEEDASVLYRQTIMFSATMPFKVEQLARNYVRVCLCMCGAVQCTCLRGGGIAYW